MKNEDFEALVPPEGIKDMDLEEAHHMGLSWYELMEKKFFDQLMTGQCSISTEELRATIPEGEEYKLKVEPPKKKEKPHPEFGG